MTKEELFQAIQKLESEITLQEQAKGPTSESLAIHVPIEKWAPLASTLKNVFLFDMLSDHAAVDWPNENQIELIYQLYSTESAQHLMVCVRIPRLNPLAPSVCQQWAIAEWQEREVYDLFGVLYSGHPDLRRLFLEDDWKGFPLLKDYKDDFLLERPW